MKKLFLETAYKSYSFVLLFLLMLGLQTKQSMAAPPPSSSPLILQVQITNSTSNIVLSLIGTGTIYWGDGDSSVYPSGFTSLQHVYDSNGFYTITAHGSYTEFHGIQGIGGGLVSVDQWGSSAFVNLSQACSSELLVNVPDDLPSTVTNMEAMFLFCTIFNDSSVSNWNVSNVTNMVGLFVFCPVFNQPLNNWNVSSVTSMDYLFYYCPSFNQPLNNWNVSNVTSMEALFGNCTSFNQPLNNWNVSNVTNMASMFYMEETNYFNQDLSSWCVSNIATEPSGFDFGVTSWTNPAWQPQWGAPCVPQGPVACTAPTSISATPTANSVALSFTKAASAQNTQIQIRLKNTGVWGGTSVSGTSHTFTGLSANTTYEYRMRSLCTGSNSTLTTVSEFTTLSAPPVYTCQAPTGISTTVNSNTSVTVNWTAAANGGLYFVQFKPSASTWAQAGGSSTSGTSRTFNYLTPGTTYDYRIRTTCTPGSTLTPMSIFSGIGQFTTTGSLPGMAQFGNGISTYPNPTQDIVNIEFNSDEEEAITFYVLDVSGRCVQTTKAQALLGSNNIQISLGSLANGLYIIKSLQGDNVRTLGKVTKQ
jgi:surface protein